MTEEKEGMTRGGDGDNQGKSGDDSEGGGNDTGERSALYVPLVVDLLWRV